jgi:hypothetical protein
MRLPVLGARRLPLVWGLLAVAAFLVALYLMAKGGYGEDVDSVGPTAESRSALGYAGIVQVLEDLGAPVIKSRSRALERVGKNGLLVIAEPKLGLGMNMAFERLYSAPSVLLILPKWEGHPDAGHAGWIDSADVTPPLDPQLALDSIDTRGRVMRGPSPKRWALNRIGPRPVVKAPLQYIESKQIRPIVANGDSILLADMSVGERRIWVLADPDIISNQGLRNPANAEFAVALFNALRTGDGPIVFDEAINAVAGSAPSPAMLLFRFPVVVATAQGLIAVALLLWATTIRFGVPAPAAPPRATGKFGLIENMAALIAFGGRHGHIIRRYAWAALRDVARRLHAPRGLSGDGLIAWLGRTGAARAPGLDPARLIDRAEAMADLGRPDEVALITLTRDINQWKQGMVDGH